MYPSKKHLSLIYCSAWICHGRSRSPLGENVTILSVSQRRDTCIVQSYSDTWDFCRVRVCASVCSCTALSVLIIADHLGDESNFLPVITADINIHSKFLQCHTDHLKSLRAGDCVDSRK